MVAFKLTRYSFMTHLSRSDNRVSNIVTKVFDVEPSSEYIKHNNNNYYNKNKNNHDNVDGDIDFINRLPSANV